MTILVLKSLSVLITILQGMLALYIFLFFLPTWEKLFALVKGFVMPILQPVQFLLDHSVFGKHMSDLVPVITFLGLVYLQHVISIGLG